MNTNVSNIDFFIKDEQDRNCIRIIGLTSSYSKFPLTGQEMEHISDDMTRKLILTQGKTVEMLYVVFSENIEQDKMLTDYQMNVWIYDSLAGRLMIYENQPEDFDAIQEDIFNYSPKKERKKFDKKEIIQSIPVCTVLLILINVIVFVIMEMLSRGLSENDKILFLLNHGAAESGYIFDYGQYYRLFTCMFLHSGFSHLGGNMMVLFFMGRAVEKVYGKWNFLLLYFVTGLVSSLVSALFHYHTYTISVGASGAIFGVVGAMVIYALNQNHSRKSGLIKIIVIVAVLLYAARSGVRDTQVDYIAHLSGVAAGMIYGLIYMVIKRHKHL